jgi:hypothetical protein
VAKDAEESEDIKMIFDGRRDSVLAIFDNLVRVKRKDTKKEEKRITDEIRKAPVKTEDPKPS